MAEVRFGAGSKECQAWTSVQLHKLSESQVSAVLKSIAHLKLSTAAAVETRRQVLHYLTKNRYAMDYSRYEQAGWPRGSGAVEALAASSEPTPMAVAHAGASLVVTLSSPSASPCSIAA